MLTYRHTATRLAGAMAAFVSVAPAVTCGPGREVIADHIPTFPPRASETCPALPWRCEGNVPQHCSMSNNVARWYPAHPLTSMTQPVPAPCAVRCVVDTVAHCAGPVTQ